MRHVGRIAVFSLLFCSSFALATPAADSAASVPDFSGTWARQAFGLEQPASGPGPIQNLEKRPGGIGSNLSKLVGDFMNPILKPEAAEILRRRGEIARSGNAFPDPSNQCQPLPPPYIESLKRQIQWLQTKDEMLIIYEEDQQFRRIRLNAQHPALVTPSWYGDSVGRFEGDTLVVDTIGFKTGPLSMVDWYGTPFSERMHLIERYRLVDYEIAKEATERAIREIGYPSGGLVNEAIVFDPNYMGKGLQVEITVEDDRNFTQHWSALVTYRRTGTVWTEYICAENTREYYANKDTAVPRDDTPDF